MEEDKPTTSKGVFLEAQMKAITGVVEDLEVLKDHIGALHLENP